MLLAHACFLAAALFHSHAPGAPVQRGLVPMFVCLIFSASWTRRLASFERSTAARELATYYFSWYMRKSAANQARNT